MKILIDIVKQFKDTFALNSIKSIFDNDAHELVSIRGEKMLSEYNNVKNHQIYHE